MGPEAQLLDVRRTTTARRQLRHHQFHLFTRATLAALFLAGVGCNSRPESPRLPPAAQPAKVQAERQRIRRPAVAGLFYPADKSTLSKTIDTLLERAAAPSIPRLKALICPHAGYVYSGFTAACGYKTLAGREVQTVVVMGPTHYALLEGASIPNADAYETPLGLVPISSIAQQLSKNHPFVLERPGGVQRPAWWAETPKPAPAVGEDTAETWEHSVEVQVPFLQKTLPGCKLLPVIIGEADPAQVAKALADTIDEKTVIVASSDLSHYHPYDVAKGLDQSCVKAICDLDIDRMKSQEACGKLPVLALMHLARQKGWKTQLLDYRNSGDVTGNRDRVVGYTAIAFYAPAQTRLAPAESGFLLKLARSTLAAVAAHRSLPEVSTRDVPLSAIQTQACFVTLTKGGVLRGCIGHLQPVEPLYLAVMHNAQNAAIHDLRFPPVTAAETDSIKIEISVLTALEPLRFTSPQDLLNKLRPHEDGVMLRLGDRQATFLPQVWAQIPDKTEFLNRLSEKGGGEPSAWRGKDVKVFTYHVEAFAEAE